MSAPTISEIVEIQSGYTSYVDLGLEMFDDGSNFGRMARYRPITSHRQAFQTLARSLNVVDGRCYLLTGSYGTGKSHLCLMFANYLQIPSGEPPMPEFFSHYSEQDPHAAEDLKQKRPAGRYLVALCQWGGREEFDEVVLKAVNEALCREGFEEDFDTHYLQALRKVQEWEEFARSGDSRAHFFDAFERELAESNSGITVAQFKKRLAEFDYTMLQEFRRLHLLVTTAPFTYDRSSLLEILTHTLRSKKFKERFLGLLVLFDEFGDTLERGGMSPKAFQQFAQLAAETPADCARLVFVATAHKSLTDYAKHYNAVEFRTASDRIKQVPLTPDGVEEIIGAIVVPQKGAALWQSEVESRSTVFDELLTDCKRLKLFEWLKGPKIRTAIIENIYPMHPMATYALLQLSRDVASNNRSVFTFFSGEMGGNAIPGSYGDFVSYNPIVAGGKLNLYTADRLCDYFADTLKSDNKELRDTVREHIRDYENSLRAVKQAYNQELDTEFDFKADNLIYRLLRLMLVHEIITVPNRRDNLEFGLYCTAQWEKDQLKNAVDFLVSKGVLYPVKETGVLEFKKTKSVDFDRMVEAYKQDPTNQPHDLVTELDRLVPLGKNELYLEAKDYNLPYSEDKRLDRRLVRAVDLSSEKETPLGKRTYFQELEQQIEQQLFKKAEYEGIALYVVCDKQEDIAKAKAFCARNESERVVVAIPKQPVPLLDAILELRALEAIEKSDERKNFTIQDNAALDARLNGDSSRPGARRELTRLRNKLMDPKEITWHGKYAQAIQTNDTKPHDVANRVMEQLYAEGRNRVPHDDLNKTYLKVDKNKMVALKEAVEELLDYAEPVVLDTSFAQARGDIRYLQKCLLQTGALRQTKTDGSRLRCEFEGDPAKYEGQLPSLAAMVREVTGLKEGRIRLAEWVKSYRKPPYGQGPVALALFLGCLRRAFGDSIRFKIDENALGDMPVKSFEDVLALVDGQYPNAFLSYRPLSHFEKAVTRFVYTLFGGTDSAVSREISVVEAHGALKDWWDKQPPVARTPKLYTGSGSSATVDFINAMQKIDARDAHAFLFEELPPALGMDSTLAVTAATVETFKAELPARKDSIEQGLASIQTRVMEGVRAIFGVQQETWSDIQDAINTWYNGLDNNQRDPIAKWQNADSKPLVIHLRTVTSLPDTFFKTIPASVDYNLRPLEEWMADHVGEYVRRLRQGKERIDANRIKVEPPKVLMQGDYEETAPGKCSFRDELRLSFSHPMLGAKIYLAEGMNNPIDPNSSRELWNGSGPVVIKDNKTVRFAAQDMENNWSQVQTLQLINRNKEFVPSVGQPDLLYGRRSVSFQFPVDLASFRVTCRELFKKGLELGVVTPEELNAAVEAAVEEARKE
jgi:hypothetical protein